MALIPDIPPLSGAVDPLDSHLVQGDGTSVYRLRVGDKGPGRLMWEFWASNVFEMVRMPEYTLADWREWLQAPIKDGSRKTNIEKLEELRCKHPDLSWHIDDALLEKDA